MIFFPAIDVKDGQCVRLLHGDMNLVTNYQQTPLVQAQIFVDNGAEYLHMVDLDGAVIGGDSSNGQAIADVIKNINIPIQLGGGIRNMQQVEYWLKLGVSRVILGTVAVKDPDFARAACKKFPSQIILAMDARGENIALEGWLEDSDANIFDLASSFADAGAAGIIYTDINRDGALQGPNLDLVEQMVVKTSLPIIASGGIGRLSDVASLAKITKLEGMICGRALYDERFTIQEAIQVIES